MVSGSGGTAPAAIVALVELGVGDITVVARNADKAARLVELATRVGAAARFCDLDGGGVADRVKAAGVLVSTLPADVAGRYAEVFAGAPVLLDAVYDPWPMPLAAAVATAGGRVISGLHAAASGVRASRTIHRASCAARGDGRRGGLACRAC